MVTAGTVRFEGERMWVGLSDGRVIGMPLAWFPQLLRASAEERAAFTLSAFGIHWEALDEDVSVEGLHAGRGDRRRVGGEAASDGGSMTRPCMFPATRTKLYSTRQVQLSMSEDTLMRGFDAGMD